MNSEDCHLLLSWYNEHKRSLPWRRSHDPYKVWISETMLQQTTTRAVLGYYDRFLAAFPTIQALANASIEQVYEMWAGLGYYSRARNLHKAAQSIVALGYFPNTYIELMTLPGLGPYTARAVSSIAFNEKVGVLDGNVIRVLSRKLNLKLQWWLPKKRAILQNKVDEFVQWGESRMVNQALMELGAMVCTPQSPHCQICPWLKSCAGHKAKKVHLLPLKKPKREQEHWLWRAQIYIRKNKILLTKNTNAPFLKSAWIFPGQAVQQKHRPQRYDFRHTITHHDIYVQVNIKNDTLNSSSFKKGETKWVAIQNLEKVAPFSLLKKALNSAKQHADY